PSRSPCSSRIGAICVHPVHLRLSASFVAQANLTESLFYRGFHSAILRIAPRAGVATVRGMAIEHHANRFVCDLVAYEPGKPIEETARELGLDPASIVKLASNENPLGPSPLAIEAMRAELE